MTLEYSPIKKNFDDYDISLHAFVLGYLIDQKIIDRFFKFVVKSVVCCTTIPGLTKDECHCWKWTGSKLFGYGRFWLIDKMVRTHRFSYELFVGKIPDGLVVHHLCHHRWCVNPKHLKTITSKENIRCGLAGFFAALRQLTKTHCPQNHPYSPQNTQYRKGTKWRICKKCRKEANQRRIAKFDLLGRTLT